LDRVTPPRAERPDQPSGNYAANPAQWANSSPRLENAKLPVATPSERHDGFFTYAEFEGDRGN
jgi:hypothetical protein